MGNLNAQNMGTLIAQFWVWTLILTLFWAGWPAGRAQTYGLGPGSIIGGTVAAAGGNYSVGGTLTHQDSGVMSNGLYAIGGSFSLLNVVQTPGAPLLRIALTATNSVALSWPSPATGFVLQQNSSLATTNWTSVVQSPVDDGTNRVVILNMPSGDRFFRLFQP
jgi:hypothetical protein